jgi:hypothetical protein
VWLSILIGCSQQYTLLGEKQARLDLADITTVGYFSLLEYSANDYSGVAFVDESSRNGGLKDDGA